MFFNYIKLAFRVLGRNKFFTAISLFGISFTLALLMLILSMLETEVGKTPPLSNKDKLVMVPNMNLKRNYFDTIYAYDTSFIDEVMVIDTTYTLDEAGSSNSNNEFGHWFLEKHLSNVPNALNYTFFNMNRVYNSYVNNSKVELQSLYTDHRFWEITDFQFTEGFGFGEQSVENEELVAVITTELADEYFGRQSNVLGEIIEMDSRNFKVIGVVKPAGMLLLSANIYVPYTHDHVELQNPDDFGFGGYFAFYLAETPEGVPLIKQDIEFINSRTEVPAPAQKDYDIIEFKPFSFVEIYAGQILDQSDAEKSKRTLTWVIYGLIGFLILLPTLNLINLNVSRIMERSSEIGVRKAFGASRGNILIQFITENIVQTLLGGLLGLILALLSIYLINETKLMGDVVLKLNYQWFMYSLVICLIFGLLSGILPAYRMSKMHVVSALKSNKL